MKIQKTELAQKLNKVRSVVPKKTTQEALRGILVKDGYLIANNMEMTVKAKIGGTDGEPFIIPERAFDLINNLPDGEMEIAPTAENTITIKADKIKNRYQTLDAALFPVAAVQEGGNEMAIKADMLLESIKRVAYAVPAQGKNAAMSAMCLQATGGQLNFVGLDGRVLAWDSVDYEGEFELLIPKNTVEKLKSIGLSGEVQIKHNKWGAVFATEDFEIHTRLVEGAYPKYRAMFKALPIHTSVPRAGLLDAMARAKMCTEEMLPVRFEMQGGQLDLSIKGKVADYHETVELEERLQEPLTIGFDARLVLETLKAFGGGKVSLSFGGPKMPMMVEGWDSRLKAIVLPVMMH